MTAAVLERPVAVNEALVRENFELWNKALLSKNPNEVAKLYAENFRFLPTFSDKLISNDRNALNSYFEHFVQQSPKAKIVEEAFGFLGNDVYEHTGKYDFEVGSKGSSKTIHARFTYIWKNNGKWQIVCHHSSELPVTHN